MKWDADPEDSWHLTTCDCEYGYHIPGSCSCPLGCFMSVQDLQDAINDRLASGHEEVPDGQV